jgi:hypothetical protein
MLRPVILHADQAVLPTGVNCCPAGRYTFRWISWLRLCSVRLVKVPAATASLPMNGIADCVMPGTQASRSDDLS